MADTGRGLTIDVVRDERLATVFASGDLDVRTVDELRTTLAVLVSEASLEAIVIDAAAVEFVDSSGLGALVAIRKGADTAGKAFRVRRPADRLSRLLDRTGLAPLLNVG